jgi:hypothetical protein
MEPWRITMEPKKFIMEPWRLPKELWRLTKEPWRLAIVSWRLTMVLWKLTMARTRHKAVQLLNSTLLDSTITKQYNDTTTASPAAKQNCHKTVLLLQNSATVDAHSGTAKLAFPFAIVP